MVNIYCEVLFSYKEKLWSLHLNSPKEWVMKMLYVSSRKKILRVRLTTCRSINVAGHLSSKVPSSIFSDVTMYPGVTEESRKEEMDHVLGVGIEEQ